MTTEAIKEQDHARRQAISQLEWIRDAVAWLKHTSECDDPDCDGPLEDIPSIVSDYAANDTELLEKYHNREAAERAVQENPLAVSVRSGWSSYKSEFEAAEYMILLCTGGPAVRIIGEIGQYNEPDTANIEYQDWGTPWTELRGEIGMDWSEANAALLTYARQFYFGE